MVAVESAGGGSTSEFVLSVDLASTVAELFVDSDVVFASIEPFVAVADVVIAVGDVKSTLVKSCSSVSLILLLIYFFSMR